MTAQDRLSAHFKEHSRVVSDSVEGLMGALEIHARWVTETLFSGGRLFFCGNGGSAADAQHLTAEYVVRFERNRRGLAAIALTTDTAVLTAVGNDFGYEQIFERQLEALSSKGDLPFSCRRAVFLQTSSEPRSVPEIWTFAPSAS